jgi:hypothetical protein
MKTVPIREVTAVSITATIAARRLLNHHLTQPTFERAEDVVQWLGAVQAQEYAGAKWALALRMSHAADEQIEQAFTSGAILRTHLLRPTWHFVTPADIRWLLALTAPRVHALNAYMYRQLELDETVFARSNDVIAEALSGGRQLTRSELGAALAQAGIVAEGMRLSYLMMRAELDGIICSGARRGKQFTYALLDERAPQARTLERDEALAELTKRYFTSHGPAQIKDFVGWSSLTVADVKAGLEMAGANLVQEVIDGKTYWCSPSTERPVVSEASPPVAYLLPPYDEYGIAYKDGTGIIDPAHAKQIGLEVFGGAMAFGGAIMIDGQILGSWRRTFSKGTAVIETASFRPFSAAESEAVNAAASRFGEFLKMPVALS